MTGITVKRAVPIAILGAIAGTFYWAEYHDEATGSTRAAIVPLIATVATVESKSAVHAGIGSIEEDNVSLPKQEVAELPSFEAVVTRLRAASSQEVTIAPVLQPLPPAIGSENLPRSDQIISFAETVEKLRGVERTKPAGAELQLLPAGVGSHITISPDPIVPFETAVDRLRVGAAPKSTYSASFPFETKGIKGYKTQ